jgi:hypothetical protein
VAFCKSCVSCALRIERIILAAPPPVLFVSGCSFQDLDTRSLQVAQQPGIETAGAFDSDTLDIAEEPHPA